MERKQAENSGERDTVEVRSKDVVGEQRGHGEGAASALALMKRLELDRAKAKPLDDRPAS